MFDFGALPPEINSARMYAGPGSGPLLAAAAAWDGVTAQLEMFAARCSALVSELHGQSWSGASSEAMAAASAPYVSWLTTTAQQAEQAAGQARGAAAAYEAAFAATVPPTVVSANRTLLSVLVATNFFGQNAAAIAATEADYAEMWAQDATAMYTYADSSSVAANLTPFTQPPPTTSRTGQSAQGAAVSQAVGAANASSADVSSSSIITAFSDINTLTGPLIPAYQFPYAAFQMGVFIQGAMQSGTQATLLPEMVSPLGSAASTSQLVVPQGVSQPILAGAGRAVPIGGLSTPPNWASATAETRPVAEPAAVEAGFRPLPPWVSDPVRSSNSGLPPMAQINNAGGRRGDNTVFRMRDRRYRMPRPAPGG